MPEGYELDTHFNPRPLIDLQSGYILCSVDQLPKQGSAAPWRVHQNYLPDVYLLRRGPIADAGVRFEPTR